MTMITMTTTMTTMMLMMMMMMNYIVITTTTLDALPKKDGFLKAYYCISFTKVLSYFTSFNQLFITKSESPS